MEHTKGKWYVSEVKFRGHKIMSESDNDVIEVAECSRRDVMNVTAVANAHHIVKCVNSHDALVKVIKDFLAYGDSRNLRDEMIEALKLK